MKHEDVLYGHWARVREALQTTGAIGLDAPMTTGDVATIVVEALRSQLMNDTAYLTMLLHEGALASGWYTTLLAMTRMAIDNGYAAVLKPLDSPVDGDGWKLSWVLLIELPEGQVSWRLTQEQAKQFNAIVPFGHEGRLSEEARDWDGHDREVKYARLTRFAQRERKR